MKTNKAPQRVSATEANASQPNERAVLVTTAHKGVFFGYTEDTSGPTITLRSARNCVYWSTDLRGFMGLAAVGPNGNCKIGPRADIERLADITAIVACTPVAIAAWERAEWKA